MSEEREEKRTLGLVPLRGESSCPRASTATATETICGPCSAGRGWDGPRAAACRRRRWARRLWDWAARWRRGPGRRFAGAAPGPRPRRARAAAGDARFPPPPPPRPGASRRGATERGPRKKFR